MRYLILLALTLIAAPSMADDSENQYVDATDTIKAIYEIYNKRGMNCDAALDAFGIEAVLSEHCKPFMESDDLISKITPQCEIVIAVTETATTTVQKKHADGVLTKGELRAYQAKGAFLKEYCGSRPPHRYKFISKTFKKIQLMGD